jgi:hypothetical protein
MFQAFSSDSRAKSASTAGNQILVMAVLRRQSRGVEIEDMARLGGRLLPRRRRRRQQLIL